MGESKTKRGSSESAAPCVLIQICSLWCVCGGWVGVRERERERGRERAVERERERERERESVCM